MNIRRTLAVLIVLASSMIAFGNDVSAPDPVSLGDDVLALSEAIAKQKKFPPIHSDLFYEERPDELKPEEWITLSRSMISGLGQAENAMKGMDEKSFLKAEMDLCKAAGVIGREHGFHNLVLATALRGVALRALVERVVDGRISDADSTSVVEKLRSLDVSAGDCVTYLENDVPKQHRDKLNAIPDRSVLHYRRLAAMFHNDPEVSTDVVFGLIAFEVQFNLIAMIEQVQVNPVLLMVVRIQDDILLTAGLIEMRQKAEGFPADKDAFLEAAKQVSLVQNGTLFSLAPKQIEPFDLWRMFHLASVRGHAPSYFVVEE